MFRAQRRLFLVATTFGALSIILAMALLLPNALSAQTATPPTSLTPRDPAARDFTATPSGTPLPSATPSKAPPSGRQTSTVQAERTSTRTPAQATSAPKTAPTPDPRLVSGRWLQSIGDCAGARREFADLLDGKPPAGDAAEARYRMAQCYLRDDAPAEAAATLDQLLKAAPASDPYRAPANFLLGDALTKMGRWKDAEKSYLAYLPLAPEIQAVTWQRVGAARKSDTNTIGASDSPPGSFQSASTFQSS